jgi:hypothetical protein
MTQLRTLLKTAQLSPRGVTKTYIDDTDKRRSACWPPRPEARVWGLSTGSVHTPHLRRPNFEAAAIWHINMVATFVSAATMKLVVLSHHVVIHSLPDTVEHEVSKRSSSCYNPPIARPSLRGRAHKRQRSAPSNSLTPTACTLHAHSGGRAALYVEEPGEVVLPSTGCLRIIAARDPGAQHSVVRCHRRWTAPSPLLRSGPTSVERNVALYASQLTSEVR